MVLPELHDGLLSRRLTRTFMYWAAVVVLAVASMGLLEYWETDLLTAALPMDQLGVFKLNAYAHLVLFAATLLYVWHLWAASAHAGIWASRLTTLGAIGMVLALVTRWFETYYLHRPGHMPLNAGYEMMALFSVVTIVFYLIMERVYRTRLAGAFVMLVVLGALLFQIWLVGSGQAITGIRVPVLRDYQMYAHVLGHFVGYGAFTVAAAMGGAYLVRSRADRFTRLARLSSRRFAPGTLPDLDRIEDSMHKAIAVGFVMFGVATILGAVWAYDAWGRYWAWEAKEIWALLVWLVYAAYFYFRYTQKWGGERLAWWSLIGFAVTVFYYFGVRAWWPGLHATYGG